LDRRSFLDWSGKATVLALGAGLISRCQARAGSVLDGAMPDGALDSGAASDGSQDSGADASPRDAGPDASTDPLCASPTEPMAFEPSDGSGIFPANRERTVDQQDLEAILAGWRLTVDGLVQSPRSLSFEDLFCLPRQDQTTDFHCVEGWSIYDVPWNGLHLGSLFSEVGLMPSATHVTFHTLGGIYNESLPLEVALEPRTLLAYGAGGNTLPLAHGFPLRIVIPRLLAYKSAKYVHRIELTDRAVEGFWVKAGYPYEALVPEGRLRPGKY
jgi:DMSO/TMAO reductase YedYZ molybdopterin-dependent catalytic subunit